MSETKQTPYGTATDLGDAVVRYVMHNERPPLELTQALRDEAEALRADRDALAEALSELTAANQGCVDPAIAHPTRQARLTQAVGQARAALARVGR